MAEMAEKWEKYHATKVLLRRAIRQAKVRAWEELPQTLEEDSWGRPYKLVMNRLRPRMLPNGNPRFGIRGANDRHAIPHRRPGCDALSPNREQTSWMFVLEIREEELSKAVKRGLRGRSVVS